MTLKQNFELLARYNQWMNAKLYDAASRLDNDALHSDVGAFFGSVMGTLNHLLVGDTIWLKRFTEHPATFRSLDRIRPMPHPYTLTQPLHTQLQELRDARDAMDEVIIDLSLEATDTAYDQPLTYTNMAGQTATKRFGQLMQHVFNHQTHHRGQITTLLSQAGIDVGVTDLSALIPDC